MDANSLEFCGKRVPMSMTQWPSRTSFLMNDSWWLKLNQDCMWNWQRSSTKSVRIRNSWPWKYCVALIMSQTLCLRVFWLMWASIFPFVSDCFFVCITFVDFDIWQQTECIIITVLSEMGVKWWINIEKYKLRFEVK